MDNSIHSTGVNRFNPAGLITGLLIGGLVGFCIVILITPQPGKITRSQIEQKSIQVRKQAVNIYGELLLLSQFDERKILSGTRRDSQSR
ncbi:MAG: YtxH domain-containing protein [Anaerolineales bacterium]